MAKKEPPGQAFVDDSTIDSVLDRESLDPEMHYRFVHERPQRVARMRAKGYRPVSASEDNVRTVMEGAISPDDTIRSGDTILMCVSKERFKSGRQRVKQITRARLAVPKQQFREKTRGAAPGGTDVRVVTADKLD